MVGVVMSSWTPPHHLQKKLFQHLHLLHSPTLTLPLVVAPTGCSPQCGPPPPPGCCPHCGHVMVCLLPPRLKPQECCHLYRRARGEGGGDIPGLGSTQCVCCGSHLMPLPLMCGTPLPPDSAAGERGVVEVRVHMPHIQ